MDSPEHRKREAIGYFETQARDEAVVHAERVARERVFDREHDVWDVHTDKGRWWVISDPWNLYPHSDFKSMDVVLSFHIGLTLRVFARLDPPGPDGERLRFPESWRRIEQADDALNDADEAEDFQSVGMRCREWLLTFARELVTEKLREGESELPVTGDFKGWAALVARKIEPRERPRAYLKNVANNAWDYVAWLTHARDAVRRDAHEAIGATLRVMTTFGGFVLRWEQGTPERCLDCGSYRLHYDVQWSDDDHSTLEDITTCESCGWEEVQPTEGGPTVGDILEYIARPSPIPEGECVNSDQIDTFMTPEVFIERHGQDTE